MLSLECQRLVDEVRARPTIDLAGLDAEGSAAYASRLRRDFPVPEAGVVSGVGIEDVELDGGARGVRARIYRPDVAPERAPVAVFLHGGGWVAGAPRAYDGLCVELATTAGCVVVSVAYRLAPEHSYPAAHDDAYAATRWVADNAPRLGGDPRRIVMVGVSAGGNLAASIALRARDEDGPRIGAQVLIYPVLDGSMALSSHERNGEGFVTTHAQISWFWDQYVPDRSQRDDPYASPLRASSLANLPPALVLGAEYDPLHDEAQTYVRELVAAGSPARFRECPGQIHGFVSLFPAAFETREALAEVADAISGVTPVEASGA